MYLLGYDIGSSSVKASLVDAQTGKAVVSDFYPKTEAEIISVRTGWAEQDPEQWWQSIKIVTHKILKESKVAPTDIKAIGISYQMHGLVAVDKYHKPLRQAIIWCDSRGVPYGEKAFECLGGDICLFHILNSPGNFTATKLAWVKEYEPELFEKIYKIMLPGDYIAMRLTDRICTTVSGLSEMMLWDFKEKKTAGFMLEHLGFSDKIIPEITDTFDIQGTVTASAAAELGLAENTPVTYRAGDQPNNALSLNVFNPGEIASTAGTSGVVYGVLGDVNYDPKSRVNIFAHVNHSNAINRLGVLLCINGTGILNSWMKRNIASDMSYDEINALASKAPVGAKGISVFPFGNGAERVLQNREIGCSVHGVNYLTHNKSHLLRAAQEGIVFSFMYGMEVMEEMGMEIKKIHAGYANMFLSPIFRNALACVSGATIELFKTDGSVGSAKGAGMGAGIYRDNKEAFSSLERIETISPNRAESEAYREAYELWKNRMNKEMK